MNSPTNKPSYRSQRRLPGWNYAAPGLYFVTICTNNRQCFFEDVADGEMHLNKLGAIKKEEILKTSEIRGNVLVDSWVVMPNHIHLIIIISQIEDVLMPRRGISTESPIHWTPGALGVIINQLKGVCTGRIRSQADPHFIWQACYYDHIIRTEGDFESLRDCIRLNPINWGSVQTEAFAYA